MCINIALGDLLYIDHFFKWYSWKQNGRKAWTRKVISININCMTSTIPLNDRSGIGEKKLCFRYDPFCRPTCADLLCDLRVSDGDLSIGDGGLFHMDSSFEWSRCIYLLWTCTGFFYALPCFCDRLWFWTLGLCSFLFDVK